MQKLHPDVLKWIIIAVAGFAVIVLIFGAGIFIGTMKARFSYRWAESYHKNFAGPRGGFIGDWRRPPLPGDFTEGHGVFGEIIQLESSTSSGFVVKGKDNAEKVVVIAKDTAITEGRNTIKKEELKVGDFIVVIGLPNEQGQIEAKLIRVMPNPPSPRQSSKERRWASPRQSSKERRWASPRRSPIGQRRASLGFGVATPANGNAV